MWKIDGKLGGWGKSRGVGGVGVRVVEGRGEGRSFERRGVGGICWVWG